MHPPGSTPPRSIPSPPCSGPPCSGHLAVPPPAVSSSDAVSVSLPFRAHSGILCDAYREATYVLGEALAMSVEVEDSGLLDRLDEAVGGFMTHEEVARVREPYHGGPGMREILDILRKEKENEDFCLFVSLLDACGASVWAEALRETALAKGTWVPAPEDCGVATASVTASVAAPGDALPGSGTSESPESLTALRTELAAAREDVRILQHEVHTRGQLIERLFRTIHEQGDALEESVSKREEDARYWVKVVEDMDSMLRPGR